MGFANPFGLLFAALYAVLVALYLWERSRHRIEVPSLLLWEAVPEDTIRSRQPRFDRLFVLQLLALTLLIAALAQPYGSRGAAESASQVVFVLDASASMSAREGAGTRFDTARHKLRHRIRSLGSGDQAMLIVAANHARVATPFTSDRQALLDALDAARPLDTGTNIEVALAIAGSAAAQAPGPVSIEVWTDLPPSEVTERWRRDVRFVPLGESDDNVAITAFTVHQSRFEGLDAAYAQAVVHNFSHREAHGLLSVAVEGETITQRGFSLAPRADRTFLFRDLPRPGVLEATLSGRDALAADDVAYAWLRRPRNLNVLAVSESAVLRRTLETIAAGAPALRFYFMTPQEYEPGLERNADVILLHRFAPTRPPLRPALYAYPPEKSEPFPGRGEAAGLEILDWNPRHPTLRGLQPLTARPLTRVRLATAPAWADVLLESQAHGDTVPIAVAGVLAGRRLAYTAFDPADEHLLGADNLPLLLFFVNLLDWLAPPDNSVTVSRTGHAVVLSGLPSRPRHVRAPGGESTTVEPEPGADMFTFEPLHIGRYDITTDGTSRKVLASLFDAGESDIGRSAAPVAAPPPPAPAGAKPPANTRGLAAWLLLGTVALLVGEWLLATGGIQRGGDR